MHVAFSALASCQIEFEIGIGARSGTYMVERGGSQRRATEVRVQDHSRGIDERQQGVTQRLAKLAFHGCSQPAECQLQGLLVHFAVADFLAQAAEDNPYAFRNRGMTLN